MFIFSVYSYFQNSSFRNDSYQYNIDTKQRQRNLWHKRDVCHNMCLKGKTLRKSNFSGIISIRASFLSTFGEFISMLCSLCLRMFLSWGKKKTSIFKSENPIYSIRVGSFIGIHFSFIDIHRLIFLEKLSFKLIFLSLT